MKVMVRFLILSALLFTACAPVYIPNVRNVPLFRGAGEFQGSVHFGTGIDVQSAVSVTDHIGLMGNFEFVDRNNSEDDINDYVKHKLWEAGVGYYDNSGKVCYEIFGGYGRGEGTSYGYYSWFSVDEVTATGNYGKFFIQPSIGSNHRVFNWIATARLSYIDFEKFTYDAQTRLYGSPVVFFEPSFTGRVFFGKSPIYSQFQAGLSMTTQETVFDYEPFHFSIGFGFRAGGKLKEKQ